MKTGRLIRSLLHSLPIAIIGSLLLSFPAAAQGNEVIPEKKAENWEGTWNIALFGIYSGRDTKGQDRDSLTVAMIAGIDRDSLELRTEFLPVGRIVTDVQSGRQQSLEELCTAKRYQNAVQALSGDTGIRIDDYMAFNWKDIMDGINILGGVETEISDEEFYYINAYVTETVRDSGIASYHMKEAGTRKLDGVQAAAYSRLKLSENDGEQAVRQKKILSLTWEKLTGADISSMYDISRYVLPRLSTSLDADEISFLIANGKNWTRDEA